MVNLRSTVVLKTDICDFTKQVKDLTESNLRELLNQHKSLISQIIVKHEGSLIKGEGDSFWIIFPSVTAAALAGIEIQQELRASQSGKSEGERLKIRVAITLGDVLHQERDIFGDSVNLTARIESITPPDEIYLSQAAWLGLNKAEVQTSFVNDFSLKGMSELEKIYRVEQKHQTRIVSNQIIVITDLKGFNSYHDNNSIERVEALLIHLDALEKAICQEYGGTIRFLIGDAYLLTFTNAELSLAASDKLCQQWQDFIDTNKIECGLAIGMTKRDLNIFYSCIYGKDINIAGLLERVGRLTCPSLQQSSLIVDERIYQEVQGTQWENKLQRIERKLFLENFLQPSPREYLANHDFISSSLNIEGSNTAPKS